MFVAEDFDKMLVAAVSIREPEKRGEGLVAAVVDSDRR